MTPHTTTPTIRAGTMGDRSPIARTLADAFTASHVDVGGSYRDLVDGLPVRLLLDSHSRPRGRWAYRPPRGVTEVPGLYFLGLSWRHSRGSALLGFVGDDAAYLADRIAAGRQATTSAKAGAGRPGGTAIQ
jgi:hypothetical protein